ncbi:MFS transporter [Kitasatospora sp. NPDC048365]|uniref:MFS transporter n=1 Tax=Kitasatospora sp. NPDC048365 TaxID=3364050 RepID=UPI0037227B20
MRTLAVEGPPRVQTRRTGWAMAALALAVLLPSLGTSIANVALPALSSAFGAPFQQVQWVVVGYLLAITTLVVGAGRLGDLYGRRRLLLGGIVLFTAASVAAGLAPTLWLLIAARAVQGLGAAAMTALAMALVGETVPKERTGRAMGLLGTVSAIGTALGPTLGGLLIAGIGWRAVFLVNVPLGVGALLLARRQVPATGRPSGAAPGFDRTGTLLLAVTLAAYALAMTVGHGFGPVALVLLGGALLGGVLFVRTEARIEARADARSGAREQAPAPAGVRAEAGAEAPAAARGDVRGVAPLVRVGMFRDAGLSAGLVTNALVSTVMMATLVVGPFHLARALGLPAVAVGLVMSAGPVVTALSGIPAGRIVDRLGAGRITVGGLTAMTVGCVLLAVLPGSFGAAGWIGSITVLTMGYALFQTANNTAVLAEVPADRRGVVSGLLNLARNLGLVTGSSALAAVFAAAAGTADLADAPAGAVADGTRAAFAVAAVLTLTALAVTAAGRVFARRAGARPAADVSGQ